MSTNFNLYIEACGLILFIISKYTYGVSCGDTITGSISSYEIVNHSIIIDETIHNGL